MNRIVALLSVLASSALLFSGCLGGQSDDFPVLNPSVAIYSGSDDNATPYSVLSNHDGQYYAVASLPESPSSVTSLNTSMATFTRVVLEGSPLNTFDITTGHTAVGQLIGNMFQGQRLDSYHYYRDFTQTINSRFMSDSFSGNLLSLLPQTANGTVYTPHSAAYTVQPAAWLLDQHAQTFAIQFARCQLRGSFVVQPQVNAFAVHVLAASTCDLQSDSFRGHLWHDSLRRVTYMVAKPSQDANKAPIVFAFEG